MIKRSAEVGWRRVGGESDLIALTGLQTPGLVSRPRQRTRFGAPIPSEHKILKGNGKFDTPLPGICCAAGETLADQLGDNIHKQPGKGASGSHPRAVTRLPRFWSYSQRGIRFEENRNTILFQHCSRILRLDHPYEPRRVSVFVRIRLSSDVFCLVPT